MIRKNMILKGLSVILAASLLIFGTGCTVDNSYCLDDLDQLDTEFTLFEDGISIPIGNTNKISIGDLLSGDGESLDDFLKVNANDEYSIFFDGKTDLNQAIRDLNLSDFADISSVSLSRQFSFDFGANTENFSIPGRSYEKSAKFSGELLDVNFDVTSSDVEDLLIFAGLDKYKNIINGNEALNLGNAAGNLSYNTKIIERSSISPAVAIAPSEEISLPGSLIPTVTLDETNVSFSVPAINVHQDVNAIRDIKLDPNAKIIIDVKLSNVFLTNGQVVPDMDIDFSSILKIEGGSKVNLKDLVLKKDNGWQASRTLAISDLVKTEYGNTISINENVKVSGKVDITDPITTKTAFNGISGDVSLDVSVRFQDFKIASAEAELASINLQKSSHINLAQVSDIPLPQEIKDVKKIYFDESKPFVLKITPNNLGILKTKDIPYSIELTFPASMDVEGAVNNRITFSGNLANGSMDKDIKIKSITPSVSGGLLSFDGNITAISSVQAQNLSVSSKDLPSDSSSDVSFAVNIQGEPKVSDYLITINEISKSASMNESLDVDVSDIGEFGRFTVIPKGTPDITMKITLPQIERVSFLPGANGVKIQIPDIIKFDESRIDPELAFNAADNSITIRNSFPENISLPISQLEITPVKEGDKYVVKSNMGIDGDIVIPETDLNQNDLEKIFNTGFGVAVIIPEIKAESISLNDNFCFNIDENYDLTILSRKDLPSELVSLDEAVLDNTYINIDAQFDGLGDDSFGLDLTLTLPDFITPSTYPIKGRIVNGKFTGTPLKVEKISGIDFTSADDISGSVSVKGSIEASGTTIDLSKLGDKLDINLNVSIDNGAGKIAIAKAKGKFKYNLNNSQSIELGDIPESFKSEDVCLDLTNPQICLDLTSNLGIPISGSVELIPIIGGREVTENRISVNNVALPYSSDPSKKDTKKYCICNTKADCAALYEPLEADISKLLRQIPDKLKITINADVDDKQVSLIEPKADYVFEIAYRLDVPLSFGSDFKFSTETTLDLSSKEVEDLTGMGNFGIKGKAVNDSPIGLHIDLTLLDSNGSVIPQTKSNSLDIAPKATSDIEFFLSSPSDKSKKVKEGKLTISVTAKPGMILKKSDSIQLVNLVVSAPEGLTI